MTIQEDYGKETESISFIEKTNQKDMTAYNEG